MKFVETILGSLFLGGMLLMLLLAEGLALPVVLGGSLLSFFYLVFGFLLIHELSLRDLFKGRLPSTGASRVISSVLLGAVFSVLAMGILFKFMIWNGADNMLLLGLLGLLPVLAWNLRAATNAGVGFPQRLLYRSVLLGGFGLLFFLMSFNTWIDLRHRNHPSYAEALKESLANPDDPEYKERLRQEREAIYGR
jgi:LPXTG-motif cell wall-anchored protein